MANPNTIPYLHYQDIQIPDVAIRNQFKQYWNSGSYSQAITYLQNAGLSGKAYLAEVINTLTNGVSYLESQYDTNVTKFLASALNHYDFLIDSFRRRGQWNNSVAYTLFNFVIYNEETYMALTDVPEGTEPTDTTYWLYIPIRGLKGTDGVDVRYRGEWSPTIAYNTNDLVTYNNQLYVAIGASYYIPPSSGTNSWMLFVEFTTGGIITSVNAPTSLEDGDIWLRLESEPTTETVNTVFKVYDEAIGQWINLYPFTSVNQIEGVGQIAPALTTATVTIASTDWEPQGSWEVLQANNTTWESLENSGTTWNYFEEAVTVYTYTNSAITDNSFVQVLLNSNATVAQRNLYQNLSIDNIAIGSITFKMNTPPAIDLPLIILI